MEKRDYTMPISCRKRQQSGARGGFTLVEMLVSVAIMLLMMSMFAQVFQLAGSTITSQRGVAENDQRSRSIQTVITADLDKRSFRLVVPWSVGDDPGLPETSPVLRKGYFYISENDTTSDVDDFIQFTVDVNDIRQNTDVSSIYGRATQLASLTQHPNQPEADDGWAAWRKEQLEATRTHLEAARDAKRARLCEPVSVALPRSLRASSSPSASPVEGLTGRRSQRRLLARRLR